eukprot:6190257-Pleurochrysis_carterae.AAC.2
MAGAAEGERKRGCGVVEVSRADAVVFASSSTVQLVSIRDGRVARAVQKQRLGVSESASWGLRNCALGRQQCDESFSSIHTRMGAYALSLSAAPIGRLNSVCHRTFSLPARNQPGFATPDEACNGDDDCHHHTAVMTVKLMITQQE